MAYTPFQDGTQLFGIPDSPVTINAVTYIAEGINLNYPTTVVELKDSNGVPIGAEVIPQAINGTAKLQLATSSTVFPAFMQTFTLQGMTFIITEIGKAYQQGGYVYANITFRQKFN